ncbi:MAG: hypothetical protein ACFFDH_02150 [Promethearchaeota archaeon]
MLQGEFQIYIYANDSFGHLNDTYIITGYKDTIAPILQINSPTNNIYWNSPPPINITVFDPNFDSVWYRVGTTNIILTNNTEELLDTNIWNNLLQGEFQIYIYANDSFGYLNDTYIITGYKDTLAPILQINSPTDNIYWNSPPPINITVFDPNFDSLWYRVGTTNIILTNNTEELLDTNIWNNLPQGEFQIYIFANDSFGHLNDTYIITGYKDTNAPTVVINTPTNNFYWNSCSPINITVFDPNFDSLWYRVGTTNILLTNNTEELLDTDIWDSLPQGEFQIYIYANDSFGHLNDTYVITGYKDTIAPTIVINSPTDNIYWDDAPPINITVFDPNFDSVWYRVGTTNILLTNNTEELLDTNIWNNLPQGEFLIYIYANDSLGNLNDTFIITGYKDTIAPTIVINSPTDNIYWDDAPPINITVFDPNFDSVWYRVGTTNILLTNNTEELLDTNIWNNLPQGEFQIFIYANDSFGHLNNTYIIIGYKDTIAPIIVINSPTNNTYWNTAPSINITVFDPNFNSLYYMVGATQIWLTNNTAEFLDSDIWDNLPQGEFQIKLFAWDSFGHLNDTCVITGYKDTIAPILLINSPLNNTYWNSPPPINITVFDPTFDSLWYRVGTVNITLTNNTEQFFDINIWNSLPDEGLFTIYFFANDSFGYLNNSFYLTIYKDKKNPELVVSLPYNNTYWSSQPEILVMVSDMYFDSVWYVVSGIKIILTNGSSEPLDSSIWDNLPDEGPFTIYFYANDSAGNINNSYSFILHKDISDPELSILFPQDDDLFGKTAPNYYIDMTELYLEEIWYTLVGYGTNFTITSEWMGFINQTAWDSFGDEFITIRFYANDTIGHLTIREVTVEKDVTAPIINIVTPIENELIGLTAPNFTIYKDGIDINTTWYTLDNGITNYTFTGTTGKINQMAWDLFGNGTVTIRFYINDTLNNIRSDVVTVRKDIIAPKITINSPPDSIWWHDRPPINISAYDPNLIGLWYKVESINVNLTNNIEQLLDIGIWNNLPQGEFKIYIYTIDGAGNRNQTFITLFKDTLPPLIIVNSPNNNTYYDNVPSINVTVYDPNLVGYIWYSVSGYTAEKLGNNTAEDLRSDIWMGFDSGEFIEIRIWCSDTWDLSEVILYIYKDTEAPEIIINSPDNESYWNSPPIISIFASDPNLNCTWYRYGSDIFFIPNDGTPAEFDSDTWNSIFDGPFTIEIFANDSFNHINNTYTLTLYKDTTPPVITVSLPINGKAYNEAPKINVSTTDPQIDSVWYCIYSSSIGGWWDNNITLIIDLEQDLDENIWDSLPVESNFQLFIYSNDTAGNINDPIILNLYKDIIGPSITIIDPISYDVFGNSTIGFNLSIIDLNPNTTWYSLYTDTTGWTINITLSAGQTYGIIDDNLWQLCPNGTVIIRFYSNDSLGNIGSQQISVYKDSIPPDIDIINPIQNERIGSFPPQYNVNIEDPHLDKKWYVLINATYQDDCTGEIPFLSNTGLITAWYLFGDGEIIIKFYANDSLGNEKCTEIRVIKDETPPTISIEDPAMFDVFGINAPNFQLSIDYEDIDTIWYVLRNGTYTSNKYLFIGLSGPINQVVWNIFKPGYITIVFYVNDTVGNTNFASISLIKNISPPKVSINLPNNQTYWNIPPVINVSAFDIDLSTIWYRVKWFSGWSEIITLTNNIEQFLDINIWNNLPQGEFQFYIYANDSFGNINNTYFLTLYKDTIAPNITILMPNEGEDFGADSPLFEISIVEDNLETCWYTIGGIDQNITFTGEIGRIDQELWLNLWNNLTKGESILIRFYANDTAGNIGFSEVEVIKTLQKSSDSFDLTKILGGPFGFLLIGLSVAALVASTFMIKNTRYYKTLEPKDKTKIKRILLLVYTGGVLTLLAFLL